MSWNEILLAEAAPEMVAGLSAPDEDEHNRWLHLKKHRFTKRQKQRQVDNGEFVIRALSMPFMEDDILYFELKWEGFKDNKASWMQSLAVFNLFSEDYVFYEFLQYWDARVSTETQETLAKLLEPMQVRGHSLLSHSNSFPFIGWQRRLCRGGK
jgi:hypothetical protein